MYYNNLPIFKSALDLVVFVEEMVKGFDRYHKYTIGAELRGQSKSILFGIAKANMTKERKNELENLRDRCEEMKMLLLVAKEIKCFKSFKTFEQSSRLTIVVCKQVQGWLNSTK